MLDIVQRLNPPGRELYVVNLTNPEQSDYYNPFRYTSPTIAKDMLINLTSWSEEHYKLNTERYLQRLVLLLNQAGVSLALKQIVSHMSTNKFTELSAVLLKSNALTKAEHLHNLQIAETSGKIAEGSIARFSTIVESEFGHLFAKNGIDIYTALRERATILFVLNPLIYPELSPLLGRLVLIDSKKAVSKMFTRSPGRSFFIFDEINVYASSVLMDLVNKSRSANVTCILATQSLSDLAKAEDDDFTQQVIENCNNYIVLRQNSAVNSEQWANILGTRSTMEVTYQLGEQGGATVETGLGSARMVREFIYHPDDIKSLKQGRAFFLSRDTGQHCKVEIHKPF
jgi:type IV secretory pathway TraG/TraD family ATPase VirD4